MFASSYIIMWVERLLYMFMWERNSSAVSLKMHQLPMNAHSLSMQFISAIGIQLDGMCG